ncbi:MAG: hypothetical protein HYZ31_10395 [Gammaproteobacteria bacterium]|nr:hypothetical protein [Gammaproteobacteria bacterium]
MFHLLVSYSGWPDGTGSIANSRIYIKDDQETGKLFLKKDGQLDFSKITTIPALLVTETGGNGPQFAHVAYITAVTQGPKETSIQYAVDNSIRPISNKDLEKFSPQLGLSKFTLTHTHWAINQADLFKILLINQQRSQISPNIFNIDSINQQEADLVSVMMPFQAEFNPVYAALQAATISAGLRPIRADDFWEHHLVIQDIVNLIVRARIVICDCSGRNPNVFYEAGIAHALGKEVILIAQTENDIPFDLRHIRYVKYLNNKQGLSALSEAVQSRIRTIISLR